MDSLRNLGERIGITDRQTLLAIVLVIVVGLANVFFIRSSISLWQDQGGLQSELTSAKRDLRQARDAQGAGPDELRQQIEAEQARLDDAARLFLSDSQTTEALNHLYQYAIESQVELASLEAQPPAEGEAKGSYSVKRLRLLANGPLPNLTDFITRIREAVFDSFVITDVSITEGEQQHALSMDIALYSSPHSSGAAVQPTPGVTVTPESLAQLEGMLATAWDAREWEQVIGLIEQILALNPDYEGMNEKLYAAYVNYGDQLLGEGNPAGATAQFNQALGVKPDGAEALVGLQRASAWAPTPTTAPPTPAPTMAVEEQLAQSLHEPWAAKNWPEVIRLIGQILAINPGYDDMVEKLYAAHVNYGQQLVAQGKLEEAKLEFTRALEVKPNGGEAMMELQALAGEGPAASATPTPTPPSQYIIHVVQRGEWLYQIARMYGTTAQAIMAANGLTSSTLYPGQQLRIPLNQ